MGQFSFDERTAKRLIREAKRSMRAPRTKRKRERRFRALSSSSGGSASAGWGKVVAHGDSTGITAADLVGVPEVSPPMIGWGYINPANISDPTSGIDDEPDSPDNLLFEVDDTKLYIVYNMTLGEIPVTEGVDVYVQWKTLEPEGKRWVDVESCVTVPE